MKRPRKLVVVHDGTVHFDEALSVAMLKTLFDVTVVRTRDIVKLEDADMRVDVGGRFNPDTGDFDHHQPDAPRRANGVKYAAAGLVWLAFGDRICGDKDVAELVDRVLIQSGDAADNGESPWKHLHNPTPYTVSFMAEAFNPTWLETDLTEEQAFEQAVEFASLVLARNIAQAKAGVAARTLIRQAAVEREDPRILVLDRKLP